ncbi:MAG: dihydroorotate dehydrogenase [Spirochaetaceae bacterium]|nr:MAG: dihydroorotate dehydrogenase [Spirochaetaceae bacterium]
MIDLSVEIAGVTLPNPVLPASGTYEVAEVHEGFFSPAELGAVINKTIFMNPRTGNPPPRIWETPCGMLNAIGIPSEGLKRFLEEQLPRLRSLGPPVIVSIAGNSIEEWRDLATAVDRSASADMIELDLSCPNLERGFIWASDRRALSEVVAAVVEATALPVISKLSPNVTDISEMAVIAEQAGTAAVSMVNSYLGMAIDIKKRQPALGNITGGLTGPAIRPLAVYSVFTTFQKIGVPIIGIGGIATWRDAVEFLLAGATAVAVGTQNFVNPLAMKEVIQGIAGYVEQVGFPSVRDLVGLAHRQHKQ